MIETPSHPRSCLIRCSLVYKSGPLVRAFSSRVPKSLMEVDILQIVSRSHVILLPTFFFCLSSQECGPAPVTGGVLSILSFNCPAFSCHSFFRPLIMCLAYL